MKQHLEKFDFLRGIAIILVIGYHAMFCLFENFEIPKSDQLFISISALSNQQILLNILPFAFGNNGVTLFLIISGFLIHYNYILKNNKFSPSLFFNKRFWRIYPPYLVALLLFGFFVSNTTTSDWLHHLFLIHNTRSAYIYSINPSFWSLALEVQLYLIYPAYLYLYNRYGNLRSFLITLIVSLIFVCLRIYFGIEKTAFYTSVFSYWVIWTIGAFSAHLYYTNKRITSISWGGFCAIGLLLILLRFTIIHQYFSPYLFAIFFVILIDKLLHTELHPTKTFKYLEIIGLCSYSIYLFHQPVFNFLKDTIFFKNQLTTPTKIIILTATTILITLLSYLSYRTLELQSIKAGHNFYKKFLAHLTQKKHKNYMYDRKS